MKKWKISKSFETALKNVMSVTKASKVSISFDDGLATISSFLSYFGAEIKVRIDGTDKDSFDVDGNLLLKAISGKDGVELSKDDNSNELNFKFKSTKGKIITEDKSDIDLIRPDENAEVQEMSPAFKTSLFSVFDKFKIASKKVNLDKLDIQMLCQDGDIFYFVGDPYYILMYEETGTKIEDMKSRMLLKYMVIIDSILKNDSDFKVCLSNGVVCVQNDNVLLNFPQISFDEDIFTIDQLRDYKSQYFAEQPEGAVMIDCNPIKTLIDQGLTMFDDGDLEIKSSDESVTVNIQGETGNIDDTFTDCKVKGKIDHQIDLANFRDCLAKLSGTIKITFYPACVLIKEKSSPNMSYILSYSV